MVYWKRFKKWIKCKNIAQSQGGAVFITKRDCTMIDSGAELLEAVTDCSCFDDGHDDTFTQIVDNVFEENNAYLENG